MWGTIGASSFELYEDYLWDISFPFTTFSEARDGHLATSYVIPNVKISIPVLGASLVPPRPMGLSGISHSTIITFLHSS